MFVGLACLPLSHGPLAARPICRISSLYMDGTCSSLRNNNGQGCGGAVGTPLGGSNSSCQSAVQDGSSSWWQEVYPVNRREREGMAVVVCATEGVFVRGGVVCVPGGARAQGLDTAGRFGCMLADWDAEAGSATCG